MDLTLMRYPVLRAAKKHILTKDRNIVCKTKDNEYVTITSPHDLFEVGFDDINYGIITNNTTIKKLEFCGYVQKWMGKWSTDRINNMKNDKLSVDGKKVRGIQGSVIAPSTDRIEN